MYWNSPKSGQCCACRPQVCDPCDACPTAETVEVTISGIEACCTPEGMRLIGLGWVNGTHTLTRQLSGEYLLTISGAVQFETYEDLECSTLLATGDAYDVAIVFSCNAVTAALDIRMVASGVKLFFSEITPPAPGELFVFSGEAACSGFVPYTFGGTATI